MPVQDHLKIAAAELMKASELLKTEISQLRSEGAQQRKTIELQIAALTDRAGLVQKEAQQSSDTKITSQNQTELSLIQRQISDKQSELREDENRINNDIREKESFLSTLDSWARNISP